MVSFQAESAAYDALRWEGQLHPISFFPLFLNWYLLLFSWIYYVLESAAGLGLPTMHFRSKLYSILKLKDELD